MRICCIWLFDSVESMMMHGLANPKLMYTSPREVTLFSINTLLIYAANFFITVSNYIEMSVLLCSLFSANARVIL